MVGRRDIEFDSTTKIANLNRKESIYLFIYL